MKVVIFVLSATAPTFSEQTSSSIKSNTVLDSSCTTANCMHALQTSMPTVQSVQWEEATSAECTVGTGKVLKHCTARALEHAFVFVIGSPPLQPRFITSLISKTLPSLKSSWLCLTSSLLVRYMATQPSSRAPFSVLVHALFAVGTSRLCT